MVITVHDTSVHDVKIIDPKVFEDSRGFFMETFNERDFSNAIGEPVRFVQDNHSRSAKGVLRGLHFQSRAAQGKLVRVLRGRVFDVAVDVRTWSPTFKCWVGVELSADNKRQLWVPPGLAHGFLCLADGTEVAYKVTEYYEADYEHCIKWNDSELNIDWPEVGVPITLSEKDAGAPSLKELKLEGVGV